MRNTDQDNLKYQKLYHWAHTLITSGVIKNMDKFPSETILQKKFGYSRQTVRTALQQLENEGLITRVRGSGTYVSYEGSENNDSRQKVGLLLSYYSDYLFSQVYDGIESALKEKGYGIEVAVTKNRLNDEAIYLEGLLKSNVSGLIIEGSRSAFPNRISVCTGKYESKIYQHFLFIIIMKTNYLTVWRWRMPELHMS